MNGVAPGSAWYAAGLAFDCLGCGRCCAGPEEGYVWVNDREVEAIALLLGMPTDEMLRQFVRRVGRRMTILEDRRTMDCIFLTPDQPGKPCGRSCRVYPVRPTQCRTWPFWPGNLLTPDCWARAAQRCPGVNRGRLFAYDEIERMRMATVA